MRARISQLHKTEEAWQKYRNWVPEAGEIIIYDVDEQHEYVRLKVGDGKTTLNELTFFINATIDSYLNNFKHQEILDGGRI
jgi:hypothetical protein